MKRFKAIVEYSYIEFDEVEVECEAPDEETARDILYNKAIDQQFKEQVEAEYMFDIKEITDEME
jgi:hypothetical protein